MTLREQLEWWKRQEKLGCYSENCPYWSELESFLYQVEKLLDETEKKQTLEELGVGIHDTGGGVPL